MTFSAGTIVCGQPGFKRLVRSMAPETREPPVAAGETLAGGEHERLVPHIPGLPETGLVVLFRRHAMTRPAKRVDLLRGKPARISRTNTVRLKRMCCRWSMTTFAADARFIGNDTLLLRNLQRSRRVACKAPQNRSGRIEDAIPNAVRSPMSRSAGVSIQFAKPTARLLQVVRRIEAAHESDRLCSGAESPISGLRRFRSRQGSRVSCDRLPLTLSRMTGDTCGNAGIVRGQ